MLLGDKAKRRRGHAQPSSTEVSPRDQALCTACKWLISAARQLHFLHLAAGEVKQVLNIFDLFVKREEGQTMAEYGVVLAVITIAVFGALALLSGNIVSAINRVAAYIT
jgi:Flp pilus assembly pilin Flp